MNEMTGRRNNMFFKITEKSCLHSFSCLDAYASVIGTVQIHCWSGNGITQAFPYIGQARLLKGRIELGTIIPQSGFQYRRLPKSFLDFVHY